LRGRSEPVLVNLVCDYTRQDFPVRDITTALTDRVSLPLPRLSRRGGRVGGEV